MLSQSPFGDSEMTPVDERFNAGGLLADPSPDGKVRFVIRSFTGGDSVLVQAAFPDKLLDELRKPGEKGKLPVVRVNKEGVGLAR